MSKLIKFDCMEHHINGNCLYCLLNDKKKLTDALKASQEKVEACVFCGGDDKDCCRYSLIPMTPKEVAAALEAEEAMVAELEKERDAYRTNYEDTIRQLKRVWTGCDTVGLAYIATEVVNKAVEDKAKVARLVEEMKQIAKGEGRRGDKEWVKVYTRLNMITIAKQAIADSEEK